MKATRRQVLIRAASAAASGFLGLCPANAATGVLRVSVNQRVNTLNPLKMVNIPEALVAELLYAT